MERIDVTAEELLEALRVATETHADVAGALTVTEMVERSGASRRRVQDMIRRAMEAGRVEHVRKPLTGIDGRRTYVPAYRLVT